MFIYSCYKYIHSVPFRLCEQTKFFKRNFEEKPLKNEMKSNEGCMSNIVRSHQQNVGKLIKN